MAQETAEITRSTQSAILRLEDRVVALETVHQENSDRLRSLLEAPRSSISAHRVLYTGCNAEGPNSILCFQTSISHKCRSICRCRCHKSTSIVSPGYLQAAVGAFFLSYSAMPTFGNLPCDTAGCRRTQGSRIQLHYYLPKWLFSRAVQFTVSWDSLSGTGASLHLKLPRVIDPSDGVWEIIRCKGLVHLRQRFAWKQNSPADVSPAGMSLLLVSSCSHN